MPLFKKSESEQRKKIYSEEEIKQRLESMNPDMQNTFIRMAESLLHKESQMFLDIVAKSRQDIMDVGQSIKEEQDVLKSTAKFLARERTGEGGLDYADDEDGEKTRIHFESEHSKKAVQDYLRAVGREAPSKTNDLQKRRNYRIKNSAQFIPEYARKVGTVSPEHRRPMTAASVSSSRPGTAYRMRMQRAEEEGLELGAVGGASRPTSAVREVREAAPAAPVDEKVKEEKEELMEHMKRMDSALQGEKERQQEAIKARKEARKAKKEAKKVEEQTQAQELLETNQEAEEQKRKNKERQEQILKERLAKKKLERRKTLQDIETEDFNDTGAATAEQRAAEMEHELGINRAKTSVEPQSADDPKDKDTKKKKKKEKAPAPVEADWGAGEEQAEPKKSKKKKKAGAEAVEAPPAGEEAAGEKKKKKKKKADAPAPDTVLDLEEPVAEEKKKKKKKKNLEELDMSVSEV